MKHRFEVVVSLKDGLSDPQGKAIEDALPTLGWGNVTDVRVGKSITLDIDAETEAEAEAQLAEMATKFLSNPVIERFSIRALADDAAG